MSFPLFDLAKDLAVARSGEGADADADPRVMRRRIAGIAWAPGAILVVLLAAWSGSWLIGVAVLGPPPDWAVAVRRAS